MRDEKQAEGKKNGSVIAANSELLIGYLSDCTTRCAPGDGMAALVWDEGPFGRTRSPSGAIEDGGVGGPNETVVGRTGGDRPGESKLIDVGGCVGRYQSMRHLRGRGHRESYDGEGKEGLSPTLPHPRHPSVFSVVLVTSLFTVCSLCYALSLLSWHSIRPTPKPSYGCHLQLLQPMEHGRCQLQQYS